MKGDDGMRLITYSDVTQQQPRRRRILRTRLESSGSTVGACRRSATKHLMERGSIAAKADPWMDRNRSRASSPSWRTSLYNVSSRLCPPSPRERPNKRRTHSLSLRPRSSLLFMNPRGTAAYWNRPSDACNSLLPWSLDTSSRSSI
jgi:hypothetical protein